jgi:sulfate/thiosulfate transport system permease protein
MHSLPRHAPKIGLAAGTRHAQHEPLWLQYALITAAVSTMLVLVVVPVIYVFAVAFQKGVGPVIQVLFRDADTLSSFYLTGIVAPVAVIANVLFGLAAAWTITRFRFPGRALLTTIIDLPFAVSPVVAGLMLLLILGRRGYLGSLLESYDFQFVGSWIALVLVTTFVTLPFVVRELIPVMEAIGPDEEIAAISLGANGWQMFWRITLPNIKWGLLYGIILCSARAIGEFGAAYVVSSRVSGESETVPLRVQKLLESYKTEGAFAVAAVLALLSLITLAIKIALEHKTQADLNELAQAKAEVEAAE